MAVNVLGLDAVPNSGEAINAVSSELMKRVQAERKRKLSDDMTKKTLLRSASAFALGSGRTLNARIIAFEDSASITSLSVTAPALYGA